MKIKKSIKMLILFVAVVFCLGAATTHDPWDGTVWVVTSPNDEALVGNTYKEIYDLRKGVALRINKEHETLATTSAGGVHLQGSARAFFQDAAPTTQIDGTAWDTGDLGSFWFDSNATIDNQFNVLTNHVSTGTWTPISTEIIAVLLAANRQFAGTLGVTGLATFTAGILSNDDITLGAGDDLVGSATSDILINTDKFTVAGATGNTVVAGTLDVAGNIDPTSYETTNGGFIDDNAMGATATATVVASAESIKAYVDASIPASAFVAKGWGFITHPTTITAGSNITSVSNDGTGIYTVTWATDFGSVNYAVLVTPTGATHRTPMITAQDAGTVTILFESTDNAAADVTAFNIVAFGAQ